MLLLNRVSDNIARSSVCTVSFVFRPPLVDEEGEEEGEEGEEEDLIRSILSGPRKNIFMNLARKMRGRRRRRKRTIENNSSFFFSLFTR